MLIYCQLKIISEVRKGIASTPNADIRKKLVSVFEKNTGLHVLVDIAHMNIENLEKHKTTKEMSPADLCVFKFAPIVSAEVERSFSEYKAILHDNQRSFELDNLGMHVVIHFNDFYDCD